MIMSSLISAGGSLLGGLFGSKSSKKAAKKNAELQRQFAQNAIQWKVADAEKAGVHPLYALGAPTMSASPSYVGDNSLGAGLANASQDISRAVKANSPQSVRDRNYEEKVKAASVTKMDLENELLKSQIAKERAQLPPPVPTDNILFGKNIKGNPNFSDADRITQRYGEPAEWMYSPIVMGADLWHNRPKNSPIPPSGS